MEDRVDALEETAGKIQSEMTQTVDTTEESDTTETVASDDELLDERLKIEKTSQAYDLDASTLWAIAFAERVYVLDHPRGVSD